MLAGELYDPLDPELLAARERARDLFQALSATRESIYCDYGSNIPPRHAGVLQLQLHGAGYL
jgi:hypothetical protein